MHRVVSNPFIRVHLRPMLHRVKNFFLQRLALHVRNNFGSDLPNVAVEHSDDDGLSLGSALDVVTDPLFVVHILEVPANEGFVNLDWPGVPADFCERAILESKAQPLQNEPCGLLRDPQVPSDLVGRNAVLAVNEHPESGKPFVKRNGGVLKDRSLLHGELTTALLALPTLLGLKVVVLCSGALRAARNAVGPAKVSNGVNTDIFVGEMPYSLLKGLDLWVHAATIA